MKAGVTLIALASSFAFGSKALAQNANLLIRKGNQLYEQQQYPDAEAEYKKALDRKKNEPAALFNLGNTLYQQKQYQEASQQFEASTRYFRDSGSLSGANYNSGNTFLSRKDWKGGLSKLENALKLNPKDEDARYNLAYAEEMLKKKGGSGGGGSKNQQNKNQNKNQNQQNKQNHSNPEQNQQNNQQNQNQPQPSKLTRQQADQLLAAAAQEEQKIQDKQQKDKKAVPVETERDW